MRASSPSQSPQVISALRGRRPSSSPPLSASVGLTSVRGGKRLDDPSCGGGPDAVRGGHPVSQRPGGHLQRGVQGGSAVPLSFRRANERCWGRRGRCYSDSSHPSLLFVG